MAGRHMSRKVTLSEAHHHSKQEVAAAGGLHILKVKPIGSVAN